MAEISHEEKDGIVVIKIIGDLDLTNSAALQEEIASHANQGKTRIGVEMSGVSYIDSSVLGALLKWTRVRSNGGDIVLIRPTDRVTRILEATRLRSYFRISKNDVWVWPTENREH